MEWLNDPRAPFVVAAYSVAAVILVGLLAVSLWQNRKRQAELGQLQEQRNTGKP